MHGEERRVTDRAKLGTFVAARHFSRQPADMTAEAGERRATGSQDASGSRRRVTDGFFMLGPAVTTALGEERPGSAADKE